MSVEFLLLIMLNTNLHPFAVTDYRAFCYWIPFCIAEQLNLIVADNWRYAALVVVLWRPALSA